ncbi:Component of IIS longevity pathway SMK-1 [Novymonas esmeraldas]|uniref:Component of IIS longevity pathway SMK-1 n=1 Tax=Novymonas esmeraldas TaxID=1808958 RepID=A0AAW0EUZ7_9TRYP
MENASPLTQAKLFAQHESGQWTEVGLGVVSIVKEPLPASTVDGHMGGGGGKRGKASADDGELAGATVAARLQMFSLECSTDLLLSSYVSQDDIYTVQGDTILLWYDEVVGSEIACSFNSKEGCDLIYRQIRAYQQSERVRRVQDERMPAPADKFLVHPRNLAAILDAAQSQNKRFGICVREDMEYFTKLAKLFHASREKQDTASMELVARIVHALLQTPYNTEGKIIAQFVENERIDDCIDIVQYALGRRDKESGFVSFAERRATFHDPCHLPEALLPRIHVLYSCGFLRDLIPLNLEPADAAASSLLGTFTLRFTMNLLTEIVASPAILPNAFHAAVEAVRHDTAPADVLSSSVAHLFELAAFVGDIAKTARTAMVGVDMRSEIFASLVRAGTLPFLTVVLECALQCYDGAVPLDGAAQPWRVRPPRAVQLVCDTLHSCTSYYPECTEDLVAEASASPGRCLLRLLLRAVTVVRTGAEAQSVVDAVHCCGVGIPLTLAMFGENAQLEARRHDVLRFWIDGSIVDRPPLFHLAAHIVHVLEEAGQPVPASTTAAAALQLSPVQERQVVYGLRVLAAITAKVDASRCGGLLELLTVARLAPALAATLVSPQRRMANVQSSVTSFMAAVLGRRDVRLVSLVAGADAEASLLHTAVRLFLQCSHRDNVLRSSLAHLVTAVCDGVHRERLTGTTDGGALGLTPFVTLLRGDDSLSATEMTSPPSASPPRPFDAAAAAVLSLYGDRLAAAAPVLHERLLRALEETPEQAQLTEAETSSIASSGDHSLLSGYPDFDAAAIDFGLETPLGAPIVDGGAEARRHALTLSPYRAGEKGEEDEEEEEDPLADLSGIDTEDEEDEAPPPPPPPPPPMLISTAATSPPMAKDDSPPSAAAVTGGAAAPRDTEASSPPCRASFTASAVAALDCVDPPSGRGSLLEDEENRLPRRASIKRGRSDKLKDEEEEEAEAKRLRSEESAA